MYVCVYVHLCTHVHMHVHAYTHTHTNTRYILGIISGFVNVLLWRLWISWYCLEECGCFCFVGQLVRLKLQTQSHSRIRLLSWFRLLLRNPEHVWFGVQTELDRVFTLPGSLSPVSSFFSSPGCPSLLLLVSLHRGTEGPSAGT